MAAFMSMAMTVSSLPMSAMGAPVVRAVLDEGESTQMVSEKSMVYVSSYDGSVRQQNFNDNWKFNLGDVSQGQAMNFDDSKWSEVTLPHDYSIEQEYSKNMEAESGYLPGGVGWYRKNFTVPLSAADKQVRIDFDGVYMNATVYINGIELGTHPYGYSPFSFDLTPYLNYGGDNVIAVKVNHQTPSSRWYSGSGIYRDVTLTMTPMVHEALYGTKVTAPDLQGGGTVKVKAETTVQNESAREETVTVSYSIYEKGDESKTPVGSGSAEPVQIPGGSDATVEAEFTASSVELWSIENPNLYVVETTVSSGSGTKDVSTVDFGFRYFDFDADTGFSLNGENIKLKGVCMHHDQGALGSEAWTRAIERQVEILQNMGCNAIRVTHNPAAKALIDICNKKGMLVIEELFDGWHLPKNGNSQDYARWFNTSISSGNGILGREDNMTWAEFDVKAVLSRDYNDPSIISWSLGNEIQEGLATNDGKFPENADKLIGWAQEVDTTRPLTFGDNKLKSNSSQSIQVAEKIANSGGMVGFNYTTQETLEAYHAQHPDWPIYGAETASSINSRGVYNTDLYDRQLTAYDESRVGWGAFAADAWLDTIRRDFIAGEFVWTGFDYIGEPTNWNKIDAGANGTWPSPKNSYFGIVDTAGLPKDSYYLYQSMWNEEEDTLHILPAWNGNAVKKDSSGNVKVVVYSDAPSVELFFTPAGSENMESQGEKKFTTLTSKGENGAEGLYEYQMYVEGNGGQNNYENLYRTWNVPYADGTLTAVAKNANGTEIGRKTVTTAKDAAKLEAVVDRDEIDADGKDLAYITVNVTDSNGNLVPLAQNKVTFQVEGNGKLVGVDNGWTTDHQSYQDNNRKAFNGQLVAIVQSTKDAGSFTVTASADGLESAVVTVATNAVEEDESVPANGIVSYELSRNYYVKTGNMPVLPETITAYYADGSSKELPVEWEDISQEQLEEEGNFMVAGKMEDINVTVSINMINQVAAALNYSTTVHVGETPILPQDRQIVAENGEILDISLPVEWNMPGEGAFDDVDNIVIIPGTVSVFGEEIFVTASVRVQEEQISIGSNVAVNASVEQNIPEGLTSDTLSAVNNGSTQSTEKQDSNGRNLSRWSNWKYTNTKDNDPPAELEFIYATQEALAQAKIYFVRNNSDLVLPDKGATKWYISDDRKTWIPLEAEETAGEENNNMVACYTYDFAPVNATYIKIEIHNSTKPLSNGKKPTTGITEVELYRSEGKFITNSTTGLESLTINGIEIASGALSAGSYSTPMTVIEELEAVGKDNAAVTILPAYEDKVQIIMESEDHSRRDVFTVNLGASVDLTPDDPSLDYSVENMSVHSCGSESTQATGGDPGEAEHVLDGDESSFWHNKWEAGGPLPDDRWIILQLDEATDLAGLRYLPRQGGHNGRINEYLVEISLDGQDWEEAASGTWPNNTDWKYAEFETPMKAKYVRLTGVKTYGDQQNKFISAAEIRVRIAQETTDISENAVVTLDQETYIMDEQGNPVIPQVKVTLDGKDLKYGIDYTLTYENNDKPGMAAVTVTGIMTYSGKIRKEFKIISEHTQNIQVTEGVITAVDGQEYTGGSEAVVESGKQVTADANALEGQVFDHWRSVPDNLLTKEQKNEETVTFTVPESSVLLTAVYREEGVSSIPYEAYSVAEPSDWFAYADPDDMMKILEASLDNTDKVLVQRGGSIETVMEVTYSKDAPSKQNIIKSYGDLLATDSNADLATDSNADLATDSNADLEQKNPLAIYNKEIPAPLNAVREELGLDEDKDLRKATSISFWIRTLTTKRRSDGKELLLTDPGLPTAEICLELPKADRDMTEYVVLSYEFSEDGVMTSQVDTRVEGNYLMFDAAVDGVYAVTYTKCFDVIFQDWDDTILSRQRVPYGEAAEAPEEPERPGYTFIGWSKEFDEVTSNMVIKAKYEKGESENPDVQADKKELEALIDQIQDELDSLDESDYTVKSWRQLERALDKALEVLSLETASQKLVDQTVKDLQNAFHGLEKNPEKPKPERPDSSGGGSDSSSTYSGPVPLDGGAYVTNGTWKQADKGWSFVPSGSSEPVVNRWIYTLYGDSYEWYYFNADGILATGWLTLDGNTFYLNPNSDGKKGMMMTGWQQIDGNWYFFQTVSDGTRGRMLTNTITPDGYHVNEKGVWK